MLSSDSLTFILIFSALSLGIAASHAVLAFCGETLRRIFCPVGILLHLLTLTLFLFTVNSRGRVLNLDVVVLFFAVSLLVYTALFFVARRVEKRRKRGSEVSDL